MDSSRPGSVTSVTGWPYTMPASASPRPRVPLVDSMIRPPGRRSPRARARSTMCSPGRSLMPPGLNPSSFAQKPRPAGASGSDTRSSGVLPTSPDRAAWPEGIAALVNDCMSVCSLSLDELPVRVHLARPGHGADHASASGPWARGSRDVGRLRASGLDPPPRCDDERHAASACAAASAKPRPYEGPAHHRGHREQYGDGHRAEGKFLGRLGRGPHDHIRRTVLGPVGSVGPMRVPARGRRRESGRRGNRLVRLLRHAMHGAQQECHHEDAADRRDESAP